MIPRERSTFCATLTNLSEVRIANGKWRIKFEREFKCFSPFHP